MDLTIIIPTKNRLYFLNKILNYYQDVKFEGCLLIIDSSDKIIYLEQSNLIDKFQDLKINHYYSKFTPLHAAKEHIDKVNTKYVTFSGDDDYQVMNGVKKCLDYLENNSKIDSVRGQAYLFELDSKLIKVKDIHKYNSYDYLNESSLKRFLKFTEHPRAIFPNIWKSKTFIKSIKELVEYEHLHLCPDRYFYDELLFTSILVTNGRIKLINEIQFIMTLNPKRIEDRNKWNQLNLDNLNKSIDYTSEKIYKIIKNNMDSENTNSKTIIFNSLNNFIYNKFIPAVKNEKNTKLIFREMLYLIFKKLYIYNFLRIIFKKKNISYSEIKEINTNCKLVFKNINSLI